MIFQRCPDHECGGFLNPPRQEEGGVWVQTCSRCDALHEPLKAQVHSLLRIGKLGEFKGEKMLFTVEVQRMHVDTYEVEAAAQEIVKHDDIPPVYTDLLQEAIISVDQKLIAA